MGLEPAFAKSTVAWPLAGIGAWPVEPDDPEFAIPRGALRIGARDTAHRSVLADASPLLQVPASEPLSPKQPAVGLRSRKWLAAILASCVFHAAVAMFFMTRGDEDQVLIEGSADAGITLLGNASEDQSAAGDKSEIDPNTITNVTMITMLDAKPVETVEAQAVPELTPAEAVETAAQATPVTETIQPVTDQPVQPMTTDPLPEILATDKIESVEDDNIVQKPVEMAQVEPVETEVEPVPVAEEIAAEAEPEPVKPEPKPEPVKPEPVKPEPLKKAEPKPVKKPEKKAEQQKKVEKTPAKQPAPTKAGSGGKGQADARRGVADGADNGTTTTKGKNGSSASAGNAAVSNYSGKVRSKLSRSFRMSKGKGVVVVSFVVTANGSVSSVSVTSSSGVPAIDKAGLDAVRRAAPFPPIPPEAGRSTWHFEIPLETR
ncbi:MAG: TonB family protein [Proteobacteria bacterium]|nr:TonB family protein [Pseudomonadota bacterium]